MVAEAITNRIASTTFLMTLFYVSKGTLKYISALSYLLVAYSGKNLQNTEHISIRSTSKLEFA